MIPIYETSIGLRRFSPRLHRPIAAPATTRENKILSKANHKKIKTAFKLIKQVAIAAGLDDLDGEPETDPANVGPDAS